MKRFCRQLKTILSAASIIVLMIVSAMLLYPHLRSGIKRLKEDNYEKRIC